MRIGTLDLPGNVIVAPLAGISDPPFRALAYRHGADLAFTEMVNAEGLARRQKNCIKLLARDGAEPLLAVQLFGREPARLAEAAKVVEELGAGVIDVNFGCPARKVINGGNGSALMKDIPRMHAIIAAIRSAVAVPVTGKIRAGWSSGHPLHLEAGRAIAEAGADAVTLHPRFRDQAFTGKADWSLIAELAAALPIPVIGNGDVVRAQDHRAMMEQTGCAGVMIGRGFLGHPWLPSQIKALAAGVEAAVPSRPEVYAIMMEHYRMAEAWHGARGVIVFRKHLIWYTRTWPGISHVRPAMMTATSIETIRGLLEPIAYAEDEVAAIGSVGGGTP